MALVLPLVLAASALAAEPPAATGTNRPPSRPAQSNQAKGPGRPFESAPLNLTRRPLLKSPLRLGDTAQIVATPGQITVDAAIEASAISASVECVIGVMKADPSIDPGFVAHAAGFEKDPMVRDDLSPCTTPR